MGDGIAAHQQIRGGSFEPQSQRVLAWGLAHDPPKRPLQVKRRPAGPLREPRERNVPIAASRNEANPIEAIPL